TQHPFVFRQPATTAVYALSLHDALPISDGRIVIEHGARGGAGDSRAGPERAGAAGRELRPRDLRRSRLRAPPRVARHEWSGRVRSEEHTSELQSRENLVCRLLLEKKKAW